MRPNLYRGQAPAKGILHVVTRVHGSLFLGQHTNPSRSKKRQAVKAAGGVRQFKKIVRQLRG